MFLNYFICFERQMKGSLNSHVFYISKMIGSVPLFFSGCCFGKKIHLICWVAGSPSRLTSFPFSLEFPQKNRKTIFCTFKIKTEKKKIKKKTPPKKSCTPKESSLPLSQSSRCFWLSLVLKIFCSTYQYYFI